MLQQKAAYEAEKVRLIEEQKVVVEQAELNQSQLTEQVIIINYCLFQGNEYMLLTEWCEWYSGPL